MVMASRWLVTWISLITLSVCLLIEASPVNERRSSSATDNNKKSDATNPSNPLESAGHAGYPELFTRKTARLLSEALHMLNRVKDVKERRWLESFVHRLALLAEELDRNEELKVKGNKTAKDLVEFSKSLVENADQLKDFVVRVESERNSPRSHSKAIRGQNEDDLVSQLRLHPVSSEHHRQDQDGDAQGQRKSEEATSDDEETQYKSNPKGQPLNDFEDDVENAELKVVKQKMIHNNKTPKVARTATEIEEHERQMAEHRVTKLRLEKLKEAEKKKILKEIFSLSQKLRELGGETGTVVDVIKRSKGGVQIGTGHHFWEGAHPQIGHLESSSTTLNPSGDQLRAAGGQGAMVKTTASGLMAAAAVKKDDHSNEDDNDDDEDSSDETMQDSDASSDLRETNDDQLVKQLEGEKKIGSVVTGSNHNGDSHGPSRAELED